MSQPLFQNVLVAINGAESSIYAAKYGILLAKQYHCNLTAVYVIDTATLTRLLLGKFLVQDEGAAYENDLKTDGQRYLDYVVELGNSKGITVATELSRGSVCTGIIAVADDISADLILLGASRYEPKQNGNFGQPQNVVSHSNLQIISNAHCSVLVVREKKIEQLFKNE